MTVLDTAGNELGITITDAATELVTGMELEFEYIAKNEAKVELREVTTIAGVESFSSVNVDGNGADDTGTDVTRAYFYVAQDAAFDTGRGFDVTLIAGIGNVDTSEGANATRFSLVEGGAVSIAFASASDATDFAGLVNTAISKTSASLNNIGSLVARLDSKEESVGIAQVNTEAAYNRIMNADMAFEQVQASKYQILQQTAIAMLAQSNMAPQGILSLFR